MIEVKDLCKVFKRTLQDDKNKKKTKAEEFYAVDHISFSAVAGEVVGILGPNGAGKTTLLRMLGGLMTPTSGSIRVENNAGQVVQNAAEMKAAIGYLSQNTKLYHRFSVREMLSIFGSIFNLSKAEAKKRGEEIIKLLSMEEFADNKIERLSTGQTQRVNIARCLVHKPDIYIFDEPTLGLDVMSSRTILEFMQKEKENQKTILYSTHYMEEAQYLCDRVIMMHQGQVLHAGTPKALMDLSGTNNLRDAFLCLAEAKENGSEIQNDGKEDALCQEE